MFKIGVLVSGGGTNLQAIIDSIKNGYIKGAEISIVISNKEGVYALERAEKAGIDNIAIASKDFNKFEGYEKEVIKKLRDKEVDLIVLAGYLKIVSQDFIDLYPNKIINIHPSLIPSFCGMGYYGLKVHE